MKKLVLIITTVFIGATVYAQRVSEAEIPAAVKTKFTSLHPYAKDSKWEMEDGNFNVRFTDMDTKKCETIDAKGNVVESKTEMLSSQLPQAARDYIAKNYADKKIGESFKVTEPNGETKYKAMVDGKFVIFDSKGNYKEEKSKKEMKMEKDK